MGGTRGGKNYSVTPLEQGRMHRLNQACIRAEKKAGQRRATRINNYKPPPEVEEARSAAKRSAAKNNYSPPTKKKRSQGGPRCCGYGPHRFSMYPGFFFCSSCDQADTEVEDINVNSRRYKCTAGHESFFFPMTKMKDVDTPSSPSSSEDDDPPLPTECTPRTPLTNRQIDFNSPPLLRKPKKKS
eukprot:scaffold54349_cov41-Attheya_sp.AAC.1